MATIECVEVASALGAALSKRRMTLATAESCTGGLVGALLTAVPGSSEYYLGGVVAYANATKTSLLDVSETALDQHGAVSAVVAGQMADGIRHRLGADVSISLTGIAGPGGGTSDKPVGLVYIGLAMDRGTTTARHVFPGDRDAVRAAAADAALRWLLRAIRET